MRPVVQSEAPMLAVGLVWSLCLSDVILVALALVVSTEHLYMEKAEERSIYSFGVVHKHQPFTYQKVMDNWGGLVDSFAVGLV